MTSIKNVEIKCLVKDLSLYRKILNDKNANYIGTDHQIDTYFKVKSGRLKLREGNVENSLIYYDRVETNGLKESNIELERFDRQTNLKAILEESLGINIEVSKEREIYFLGNIKIHLDYVDGLGSFVEIEAIDTDNKFSLEQLNEQCKSIINLFKLDRKNFMALSYSDFFKIKKNHHYLDYEQKAKTFYKNLLEILPQKELIENRYMDHLCYRVASEDEYESQKEKLSSIATCLVESQIGGRLIATYKLEVPIIVEDRAVYLIELPAPKKCTPYSEGFEHAEFVITESFDEFSENFNYDFDWKGSKKEHNPELRLKMNNLSIKFHHIELEKVIAMELKSQS